MRNKRANGLAEERFINYKYQALDYTFPTHFTGKIPRALAL